MEKHLQEYIKNYLNNMSEFKYDLGILGLGYVGLPLAVSFAKKFEVYGMDLDQNRIKDLKLGIDKNLEFDKSQIKSSKKRKSIFTKLKKQHLLSEYQFVT